MMTTMVQLPQTGKRGSPRKRPSGIEGDEGRAFALILKSIHIKSILPPKNHLYQNFKISAQGWTFLSIAFKCLCLNINVRSKIYERKKNRKKNCKCCPMPLFMHCTVGSLLAFSRAKKWHFECPDLRTESKNLAKHPPKWLGRHLGHAFPFSGEFQANFWKCF